MLLDADTVALPNVVILPADALSVIPPTCVPLKSPAPLEPLDGAKIANVVVDDPLNCNATESA